MDTLEQRLCPAIVFTVADPDGDGNVDVMGVEDSATAGPDTLFINVTSGFLSANGSPIAPASAVEQVDIRLGEGDDQLTWAATLPNAVFIDVYGGDGNDQIVSIVDVDVFFIGDAGNDTLIGAGGADFLSGGAGNDLIVEGGGEFGDGDGGDGDDIIVGGNTAFGYFAYGGAGNDVLVGGSGDDGLYGEKGDDVIIAQGGDDDVSGGTGTDIVFGGAGTDSINTEDDDVRTATVTDALLELTSSAGVISVTNHDGIESFVFASSDTGTDGMSVNAVGLTQGFIQFYGSTDVAQNDTIFGGAGNDIIDTGLGDDSVFAGAGNDTISSDGGNDLLSGGTGDDTFRGSSLPGVIVFRGESGVDTVTDCQVGDIVIGVENDDCP